MKIDYDRYPLYTGSRLSCLIAERERTHVHNGHGSGNENEMKEFVVKINCLGARHLRIEQF